LTISEESKVLRFLFNTLDSPKKQKSRFDEIKGFDQLINERTNKSESRLYGNIDKKSSTLGNDDNFIKTFNSFSSNSTDHTNKAGFDLSKQLNKLFGAKENNNNADGSFSGIIRDVERLSPTRIENKNLSVICLNRVCKEKQINSFSGNKYVTGGSYPTNSRLRKEIESFSRALKENSGKNQSHINRPMFSFDNKPELDVSTKAYLASSPTNIRRNVFGQVYWEITQKLRKIIHQMLIHLCQHC
jgi:hypothetical protein